MLAALELMPPQDTFQEEISSLSQLKHDVRHLSNIEDNKDWLSRRKIMTVMLVLTWRATFHGAMRIPEAPVLFQFDLFH
ncbi:hypothetical protein Plhal304r1_c074g0162001 [Plasmopara halstedii]